MTPIAYSVSGEVFARYPGYVRGVVLAFGVTNRESPPELIEMLRDAEAGLRRDLHHDNIADHPRIQAWREAYRRFGAKPSEFRSSVEAMARRVLRGDSLPSINALVDIGNYCALLHLVNIGGHAIDELKQDIQLKPAAGDEVFIPFGSDQEEHPLPGEIIFAEGGIVLTRRWTWRQANHTLTVLSTTEIEFNIDGLPPVTTPEVEAICVELVELIRRFCGGSVSYSILSRENPTMILKG